jgi:peptidoglycan/LPS O-acetylase OafA/YrhL
VKADSRDHFRAIDDGLEQLTVAPPSASSGASVFRFFSFSSFLSFFSRETTSGRFIPEVDGLRFIAIAMVVLFHLNAYLLAKTHLYEHGAHRDWSCRMALEGFHGVELFFVISGFILALPFAAHRLNGAPAVDLGKYYMRRLTRLEPPYIVTLLVLTVLGFAMGARVPDIGAHLSASLFYLHNLIYGGPSPLLGVAWSLEIEVQFYVLVPLLTLVFSVESRLLRRSLMVGLALAVMAFHAIRPLQSPRLSISIAGYLQFFLIGFLLADLFLSEWKTRAEKSHFWDIAAFAGWLLLFLILRSKWLTAWVFPAGAFVLYCAAFRGRWISRLLSYPWITAIGGMCYSIYLIHYEVISAVARFTKTLGQRLPNSLYLLTQFLLVGIAILLVCGLYFVILEKPCMKRDWPKRLWFGAKRLLPSTQEEPKPTFAD